MSISGFSQNDWIAASNTLTKDVAGSFWTGIVFRTRSTLPDSQGGEYTIFGHDNEENNNFTGGNDSWFAYSTDNQSQFLSKIVTHMSYAGIKAQAGLPSSSGDDRVMDLPAFPNGLLPSTVYVLLMGQQQVGGTTWRSWRAIVEAGTGAIIQSEVADSLQAYYAQTLNKVCSFWGRQHLPQTTDGMALENYVHAAGDFPFNGNAPDAATLFALGVGTTDWDTVIATTGATKLYHYTFMNTTDLTDKTGVSAGAGIIGLLSDDVIITPWLQDPISVTDPSDGKFQPILDTAALTGTVNTAGTFSQASLVGNINVGIYDVNTNVLVAGPVVANLDVNETWTAQFLDVPAGGPYYARAVDDGGTASSNEPHFYVGYIFAMIGQSQIHNLFTDTTTNPANTAEVWFTKGDKETTTPLVFDNTNIDKPKGNIMGVLGNAMSATVPQLYIDISYPGKSLADLFALPGATNPFNGSGALLWDNVFVPSLQFGGDYYHGIFLSQGSSDTTNPNWANDFADMLTKLDITIATQRPVIGMVPMHRQTSGNPQALREIQYNLTQGPSAELAFWFNEAIMDGIDSPHLTKALPSGEDRFVKKIGGYFARKVDPLGPDVAEVTPTASVLGQVSFTQFDIFFSNTTGLVSSADGTEFNIRVNGGAWQSLKSLCSVVVNGTRLSCTLLTGTFVAGDVIEIGRYLYDYPMDTPLPYADELAVETALAFLVQDAATRVFGAPIWDTGSDLPPLSLTFANPPPPALGGGQDLKLGLGF